MPPKKNIIEEPLHGPSSTTTKKSLGQYFTVAPELQDFVFNHVQHKSAELLEPSFGAGHLLKKFKEANTNYPMTCYEIDRTIKPVIDFNKSQTVIYGDFLDLVKPERKFKTIIGNPPFVAIKKAKNLYIQFIEKCYELLAPDGEMIFIVPSDFIKLTSAAPIIEKMCATGSFTDFLFPHNERLFDGAAIDVVCFRYQLGLAANGKCTLNGIQTEYCVKSGIITFGFGSATGTLKGPQINELFGVYVGLVSGRDEIYRSYIGNMDLLMDKDKVDKFIFVDSWPPEDLDIERYLESHKNKLLARRIRKFNEDNWYEWGAPRNIATMKAHAGRPCIYVRTLTRQKEVAFMGSVQFFGGGLLCLIPKDGTEVPLEKIVGFLNSSDFQKDYLYAGRFKIGHKQISNVILQEPLAQPKEDH